MSDTLNAVVANARQFGAVALLVSAAFGYGHAALRATRARQRGIGGGALAVLVGLGLLTGVSGWLCLGWAFRPPVGIATLLVGWALCCAAVVEWLRSRAARECSTNACAGLVPRGRRPGLLAAWALVAFATVMTLRAYAHQFAWADDWRYHLTVPRRILAHAGYRYDSFMVEANFNYGGAHGLHALVLLLGDEVTFQMLSPAVASLLLGVVLCRILRPRYGSIAAVGGVTAMFGGGFFWAMGFNTLCPDVLMAAMVAGLLWLLLERGGGANQLRLGIACGVLVGALVAMKKVNVFVLPLFAGGYVLCAWHGHTLRPGAVVRFASGAALGGAACLLPWVLIEWRNTGSPFYPFIGDLRHVNAWFVSRELVLLDAPRGLANWMWTLFRQQYLEARGGLLWVYALVIPGALIGLLRRRPARRRLRRSGLPPAIIVPATLLFSGYMVYSRGAALNTHMRYLMPMMLPGIALLVAWSLHRYLVGRRAWPRVARRIGDGALVALLLCNVWASRQDISARAVQPALSAGRALVWGDLSARFWNARGRVSPYGDVAEVVPLGAKVLTFVQKTALIDAARYDVHSLTKAMTGVVDVHRLSDPTALLEALRSEGFEYVVLTFEWIEGESRARQQAPSKLSDWTATARTLENLVRLRELDEVETLRAFPDALILRVAERDELARGDAANQVFFSDER